MIVTLTANPSVDRTARIETRLQRGGVMRLSEPTSEPGGKGVNVARAVHRAGVATVAVLPADAHDPLLGGLDACGVGYEAVGIGAPVRTNFTITEPDGTTTKLNQPGARLGPDQVARLEAALVAAARGASWVALCGSLPPGAPGDWYPRLVELLRPTGARIAVDTSGPALRALAAALPGGAPDLIKPNSEELAQLTGADGAELERRAAQGHLDDILAAGQTLLERGIGNLLITLGAAGAVLLTPAGTWRATPPPVTVRSTVGAGDCSLAGFLLAAERGEAPADCLRSAVAYGSCAASLAGSAVPAPDQVDLAAVRVAELAGPVRGQAVAKNSPPTP